MAQPPPDAPTGGLSETGALERLRARGYEGSFSVTGGGVRCERCGRVHDVTALVVEEVLREEGASNPDDEAIVLGLRCPGCDATGTLVSAYGPDASAEEADVLRRLADHRPR